jgi:hypothetical protein
MLILSNIRKSSYYAYRSTRLIAQRETLKIVQRDPVDASPLKAEFLLPPDQTVTTKL